MENKGRGGAILTPNELVLTFVSNLVKIDEEMRPGECPQTDTHTHARTHGQTQNDIISERTTLRSLYAIGRPSVCMSVCLLSVCDVGAPYSGG